jgi:YfiH family protein
MSGAAPIQSALLAAAPGLKHGFFTREGGVSTGIYAGLNFGRGSKDDPANAAENRARAMAALDAAPEALATAYQIHSPDALTVTEAWSEPPRGDALVTDRPGLALGVVTADCAPVLLVDEVARVIGAAHAGWRGALSGVIENTVAAMERLGARRGRITAAVGPCIAQPSYEVGREFYDAFVLDDTAHDRFFAPGAGEKLRFDLKGFCAARLAASGVTRTDILPHDTYADERLFYSNRRAVHRGEGDYGRLLSAIMLSPS